MSVHLLKASLRANAATFDSYSPKGWSPKLQCAVMGPVPAGAELVLEMKQPGGGDWFEHRVELDELGEEEGKTYELHRWDADTEITEVGDCAFTLRAVSELEGVDELLHTGTLTVTALEGEHDYAVALDWLLPLGLVALDVDDDKDAPPLRVTVFLGGEAEPYEVEAFLFKDGKKVSQSTDTSSGWTASSTGGTILGREILLEFDEVRGWNNIRESDPTWGDGWFWLDLEPGSYEVRGTRGKKVVRVLPFTVGDEGRIVTDGRIEPDVRARPTAWVLAEAKGDLDGIEVNPAALAEGAAYGGDLATAALTWNSDGMYWYWKGRTAGAGDAGPALDEETAAALQGVVDGATTLLRNWEADMAKGRDKDEPASYQSDFLTQCEHIVIPGVDSWEAQRAALDLPDDHAVEVLDEATSLGAVTARVLALRDQAKAHLSGAAQETEDILAPFRAVLRNDKLAVFEDHPAPGFEYLTTNKKLIETPEELAEAEYWYFEGVSDIEGTAEVDGKKIKGTVRGWRVLGYRFDDDHNIIEEYEEQDVGSRSPKSAYQHGVPATKAKKAKKARAK